MQSSPDSLLFTPRLYTSEKWGTQLSLENFSSLPSYQTRTLVLSSPVSCADFESDVYEWVIEFSPKGANLFFSYNFLNFKIKFSYNSIGVWFRTCCLIGWQGNIEIPETVLRTVRLSLTLKVQPINLIPISLVF